MKKVILLIAVMVLVSGCAGKNQQDAGLVAGTVATTGIVSVLNPCAGLALLTRMGTGAVAEGLGLDTRNREMQAERDRLARVIADLNKKRIEGERRKRKCLPKLNVSANSLRSRQWRPSAGPRPSRRPGKRDAPKPGAPTPQITPIR